MAKTSITPALAAKYPEFANRVGETVEASEIRRVESDFKLASKDAKKASVASTSAPRTSAPKVAAPRKRAPRKKAAKKATA